MAGILRFRLGFWGALALLVVNGPCAAWNLTGSGTPGTPTGLWIRAKLGPSHSLARGDGWGDGKGTGSLPWLGDYSGWGRSGEAQAGWLGPPEAATRISLLVYGQLAVKEVDIGEDWDRILGSRLRTWSTGAGLGLAKAFGPANAFFLQAGFSYQRSRASFVQDTLRIVPGYAPSLGFRGGVGWEYRPFRPIPELALGLGLDYDRYVLERRSARVEMADGYRTRLDPSGDRELLENSLSMHLTMGYAFHVR